MTAIDDAKEALASTLETYWADAEADAHAVVAGLSALIDAKLAAWAGREDKPGDERKAAGRNSLAGLAREMVAQHVAVPTDSVQAELREALRRAETAEASWRGLDMQFTPLSRKYSELCAAARALLKKTAGDPDACPEWEQLDDLVRG